MPFARSRKRDPEARPTAWSAAIALIARRDLSEGEVRERLARREYPEADIDAAIERLSSRGYLDDARLAIEVARIRARRGGYGPARIRLDLRRRRFGGASIGAALSAAFPEGEEDRAAARALARFARREAPPERPLPDPDGAWSDRPDPVRKWQQRQFRRLVNRGFSPTAARKALFESRTAERGSVNP